MSGRETRGLLEALTQAIAPGGALLCTWELEGGVSAQVTAFELERPGGAAERLVVRRHGPAERGRNPQIAADEFRLLVLLGAEGIPVPRPRYLDESIPALVVDYVDGGRDPAPLDGPGFVGELATVLSAIHAVPTADVSFLPERGLAESDVLRRRPGGSRDERRIRDVLASAGPRRQRNPSVLLHGDFWPGNTLWKDGRLVAVLDWEDAAIGDPLADVANARLELLWALGSEAMDEFTRRYETAAPAMDLTDLPYWDLRADLRLAGRTGEWGLDAGTLEAMRVRHEQFVAQALEKLSAL
jgi:aminoglycoside phosphotransferase (APT) family kinase protein